MPPNGSLNTNSLVQTPSNPSHLIPSVTTPTTVTTPTPPISYSSNVRTPVINNVTTALPSQLSTPIVINHQIFPGPAGRLPILVKSLLYIYVYIISCHSFCSNPVNLSIMFKYVCPLHTHLLHQ